MKLEPELLPDGRFKYEIIRRDTILVVILGHSYAYAVVTAAEGGSALRYIDVVNEAVKNANRIDGLILPKLSPRYPDDDCSIEVYEV